MNRKRILIIENDEALRILFRSALESEGYHAVAVENATETVLKLMDSEPDGFGLVLLGMLGSRSGWLHSLKTLRATSCRAPVAVTIGFMMPDEADIMARTMAHGAVGCLTGPLDTENLMAAVRRYFQPRIP